MNTGYTYLTSNDEYAGKQWGSWTIALIKRHRTLTGAGLKEAKDLVEALTTKAEREDMERFPNLTSIYEFMMRRKRDADGLPTASDDLRGLANILEKTPVRKIRRELLKQVVGKIREVVGGGK